MTLHEIEETVRTLSSRHPRLDEVMLVTLLRAGGWEEKDIEEAKLLWRLHARSSLMQSGDVKPEVLLPPIADVEHLLLAHNEPEIIPPVSLVTESVSRTVDREAIPHNLPLRPFETSEHIWPFSRYRDVFYGDAEIEKQIPKPEAKESAVTAPVSANVEPIKEERSFREVIEEKKVERVVEMPAPVSPPVVHVTPTSLSGGDEKLVVTACVMLLLILLLLGYMYSNGRL